jgi:hypothetical protein
MHQHNPDLIMALAEGQLASSDAATAEAEFAACAECSADLKAQRLALEVLHGAPAARLTATERLGLHETLRRELRLTEDLGQAPAAPQRRRRWTAGWAFGGAAAVLVAVLAVAPGLRLISQGDDDSAAEISALTTQAVTTTTAAFSSGDALVPGPSDMSDAAGEELEGATGAPEASTTTAQTTTTAPFLLEDRVALETGESPEVRLNEFFSSYERAAGDPEIAVQLYAKSAPLTTPSPGPTSCTPPSDLMIQDAAVSFTVAVVLIDRVQVPVIGYAVPGQAEIVLVVFDPETCDVIFSLP